MFDKAAIAAFSTYYKAKAKVSKLFSEESGMETIETVILIAVAVILAGFIVNFLTKGHFGDAESDQGLIGYIFEQIGNQITNLFGNMDPQVNDAGEGETIARAIAQALA